MAVGAAGAGRIVGLNAGSAGAQPSVPARQGGRIGEVTIAAGSSASVDLDVDLPTDRAEAVFRLRFTSRDAATGARGVAEAAVLVARGSSALEVAAGPPENRIGAAFGPTGLLRVDVGGRGDAGIGVSIANSADAPATVRIELD
jgi:hypothetical protein